VQGGGGERERQLQRASVRPHREKKKGGLDNVGKENGGKMQGLGREKASKKRSTSL